MENQLSSQGSPSAHLFHEAPKIEITPSVVGVVAAMRSNEAIQRISPDFSSPNFPRPKLWKNGEGSTWNGEASRRKDHSALVCTTSLRTWRSNLPSKSRRVD